MFPHPLQAIGNCWSQLQGPARPTGDGRVEPAPTVVLDSWADGPAVRWKDTVGVPKAADVTLVEALHAHSGTHAHALMRQAREACLEHNTMYPATHNRLYSAVP